MTDYPLVTGLMPTYNRRRFIPRSIEMFLAQSWPNKELVVLDDGDDCIEDLIPVDPRIQYVRIAARMSLGAKLNFGASVAAGEIVYRQDDDDFQSPDRISLQVAHMRLTCKPVVGLSSLVYYSEGKEYGWEYEGDSFYASGSSHCCTREWLLAHPYPDITVGEDNIFAAEAGDLGAISTLSGTTCLVACDHPGNCSVRHFGADNFEFMRETADNFRRVPLAYFASTIGPYGPH